MTRYIFVTGGIVSSLGKGIAASSIAVLLEIKGYKIRLIKLDPYLNCNPGNMSPYEYGEVFVTEDGGETDLDIGHYERFTGRFANIKDNITTDRIYRNLIECERRGDYLDESVKIIPHFANEIKKFITLNNSKYDFVICEIGGKIGDIEAIPFLEAIRQIKNCETPFNGILCIHLTLIPFLENSGELKKKSIQFLVKELKEAGIPSNILLLRSDRPIPESERQKLSLLCNIRISSVIQSLDVESIYDVPLSYHDSGLDSEILSLFGIHKKLKSDMRIWKEISHRIHDPEEFIKIAIVGKYTSFKDSYKSLIEALNHGGIANKTKISIKWIEAEILENQNPHCFLKDVHGILVPGGFGYRGTEGKVLAIQYARENKIPFFGICFGMQMACIEIARNISGFFHASSTEFGATSVPVISIIKEYKNESLFEKRNIKRIMRLGSYRISLKKESHIAKIYQTTDIYERHRHKYEINISYKETLEKSGLIFSGTSYNEFIIESIEYLNHPWFIGVQYHPEFKSHPFNPHPLFTSFIKSIIDKKNY